MSLLLAEKKDWKKASLMGSNQYRKSDLDLRKRDNLSDVEKGTSRDRGQKGESYNSLPNDRPVARWAAWLCPHATASLQRDDGAFNQGLRA